MFREKKAIKQKKILVILNDHILGTTTENTITISRLDTSVENNITLIPLSEETKGEGITIPVKTIITSRATTLPKAPNTGKN